jgi:DnaK suppressor protein
MTHAELKLKLEEELDLVSQELADLGHEDIDPTATEPDELADRQEANEESAGETGVLSARQKEIVFALKRMQDGTYGMCEECGEKIEEDRLEANPAARTCRMHME